MRYFRMYPLGIQILLFLLMIITLLFFGYSMIGMLMPKITGLNFIQITAINERTPRYVVNTSLLVQGIMSICMYLLPALLYAYLSHPEPGAYLGLRRPAKGTQMLLSLLVMAGAMPLLVGLQNLVGLIDFSAKIKAEQATSEAVMRAFMHMDGWGDFIRALVVMAIVPAFGEELFFRGVLMRFAKKRSRSMVIPILFTSAVFSYSHANIYGYLSIFMAGVLLAVIYNLTGSLWCSIAGHLFNNGAQIVLSFMGGTNASVKAFVDNDTMPITYVVAGALLFAVSLFLLIKNKTPLPNNWAEDFSEAELTQMGSNNSSRFF